MVFRLVCSVPESLNGATASVSYSTVSGAYSLFSIISFIFCFYTLIGKTYKSSYLLSCWVVMIRASDGKDAASVGEAGHINEN